ncbi:hypothetical protein [Paraburkholderia acidiphila]|uniref:Uncharacterized protein n=1 Tax=Paraburkholderia acidiphila TaxID=2571747 RepID=A0A7Z2GC77_9BURK|nr:hypothetical protein [Paraburkholderia acidiphila]QGZ59100.1 hypothetical protein FAZ97_29645 [Paraburkholderia acidiphila]
MGRIALLLLILMPTVGSGYADEASIAGGTSTSSRSCVTRNQPQERLPSPAAGSSIFAPGAQACTAGGSGGLFPVLPRGQRQFDVESSKLRGQRFRWHAL